MTVRPILVNQQKAAEMLGMSVSLFTRLCAKDHRLMPAVIPDTKSEAKRYLVSDLEEWARSLKYPHSPKEGGGGMWDDESAT
ncbi:hypothetical protein [Roseibium sp. RKSG952]|uniref:hypothetical protein n=1 Tax=Roseibium sp. RKSG952 TaxID=2529384 RepID=UPI0012BBC98F|nr:hypothetical protein [Roseibium sp. RKSG952]MTH96536.1 hypothetical protein [Roseibium sp. RKSG952]